MQPKHHPTGDRASLLVFILTSGIMLVPSFTGVVRFDEGAIVTGSAVVAAGGLLHRDFFTPYGPAQYYIVAALFQLLGHDLVWVRVLQALTVGGLVATVYALSRTFAGGPAAAVAAAAALAGALASQLTPAYPAVTATLFVMLAALALARSKASASGTSVARYAVASMLIGVAGLFRWDIGVFGLAGLVVAEACRAVSSREGLRSAAAGALAATVPALGIMGCVYVVVIAAASPSLWFDEVLRYVTVDVAKWRETDWIKPAYWQLVGSAGKVNVVGFYNALLRLLLVTLPILLIGLSLLAAFQRLRRREVLDGRSMAAVMLAVSTLLLFNQMRVRPWFWQAFPMFVASLPLLAVAGGFLAPALQRYRFACVSASIAAVAAGLALLVPATHAVLWALEENRVTLGLSRATAIRVDPETRKIYQALVKEIHDRTAPGEAIYSGVVDHTRLSRNDVLVYFLANRPAPTRYAELAPGLANSARGQREIVDALARRSVKLVVLLRQISDEPNLSSKSVVPRTLDDYIRENFTRVASYGPYAVMVRRSGSS